VGTEATRVFAVAGHPLLLISRNMELRPEFASRPVAHASVDVADYDGLRCAFQEAEQRFGPPDCLVNSAGIADARPFDQVEPTAFEREVRTNRLGVLNGVKAVLAGMVVRADGNGGPHEARTVGHCPHHWGQ
jgi:NADP-dependent 3-hydroxy acid dehydrogenase YdfG